MTLDQQQTIIRDTTPNQTINIPKYYIITHNRYVKSANQQGNEIKITSKNPLK